MNKSKIEWCDTTWNPVWGCLNNCPYCYARKIAKRFYLPIMKKEFDFCNKYDIGQSYLEGLQNFKPTFLWSNFYKKFPKKPSRIFVNSMSDIRYWKEEWMRKVINKIKGFPQHTFIFLTKFNMFYSNYDFPENCWLGYTVNTQHDLDNLLIGGKHCRDFPNNKWFISLEPIQERCIMNFVPDWLIIGAETGNRKNKIVPEREWLQSLVEHRIYPVFLKDNLKLVWGENLI